MSYESRKGYVAEYLVQQYLREIEPKSVRPRAGGPQDVGDITGLPLVVSVKNHARLELSTWVDALPRMTKSASLPTGVVWHKRQGRGHPRDWYVTTTGGLFMPLLQAFVNEWEVVDDDVVVPGAELPQPGRVLRLV